MLVLGMEICFNDWMSRKKKGVKKILGTSLIFVALLTTFIYWFFGVNYIISAYVKIKNIPESSINALVSLNSRDWWDRQAKGILLRKYGKDRLKGVLVWNLDGIKYYKSGENIKFNSFSICEDGKWNNTGAKMPKNVNINYDSWEKKTKQGDFVEFLLSGEGYVEDITVYDWWVFAQPLPYSYFELTCKKR